MPGLLSSSEDLAFMARVTTGDQVDTPITPILTGIAGSGGTATGAIGRAAFASQRPRSLRGDVLTVIL